MANDDYPHYLDEQRRRSLADSAKKKAMGVVGKSVAGKIKEASALTVGTFRMLGFGALSMGAAVAMADLPQPIVLAGMAASLLSLKGKRNEKTTKRKFLFAAFSLAAQPPAIGTAMLLLPTPINPIVYLMRKVKDKKANDLAVLTAAAAQDRGKALVAQVAGLPRGARKGLAEKTMAPEKGQGRKRDTPPPLPGIS